MLLINIKLIYIISMDTNLISPNDNNEPIQKPIGNEFNPNTNALIPEQNPQNITPPQGNNNQDFQTQSYPNYPNQSYNQPNPNQPNKFFSFSPNVKKYAYLVMSIIQFLYVVIELVILIVNNWIPIPLFHLDELGILVVSTIFFLTYLDKFKISPILRHLLTVIAFSVGVIMRIMAFIIGSTDLFNNSSSLIVLTIIRIFLIISIPISHFTFEPSNRVG